MASGSPSCPRPRASCRTTPRATPTSAAKSSAGSTRMSRIGKKAVPIPNGVTVSIEGQTVTVKGTKGQLAWTLPEDVTIAQEGDQLTIGMRQDTPKAHAMWGLSRTLVNNMVVGVTSGYERTLE